MVDHGRTTAVSAAAHLLGRPRTGGVLLVADHASAHVPEDIELGIAPSLLEDHIAVDRGVAAVAALLVGRAAVDAAWLGAVSRLVVDCNREVHAPGVIPIASDGHAIPGNLLDHDQHEARLARYYRPYHEGLASLIATHPPSLILSLHSFTPKLSSHPDEQRPWEVGILYNADDRLAHFAIPWLAAGGWQVGDQQPYSGRMLNHTMNFQAEANGIPYLGVEMRQDIAGVPAGAVRFADALAALLRECPAQVTGDGSTR